MTSLDELIADAIRSSSPRLKQYGVKGMRWGVHKDTLAVSNLSTFRMTGLVTTYPLTSKAAANPRGRDAQQSAQACANVSMKIIDRKNGPFAPGKSVNVFNRSWDAAGNSTNPQKRNAYDAQLAKLLTEEAMRYTKAGTSSRVGVARDSSGQATLVLAMGQKVDVAGFYTELAKRKDFVAVHADTDQPYQDVSVLFFKPVLDENGLVTGMEPIDSKEVYMGDSSLDVLIADAIRSSSPRLKQYGVKGMRWGVRKKRETAATGPEEVKLKIEPGKRIKTAGGRGHSPSSDAKQAAAYKQLARASSVDALSNKQLQALIARVNLEQQYSKMNIQQKSAGRKFLESLVKREADSAMKGKTGPVTGVVLSVFGQASGTGGKHRK